MTTDLARADSQPISSRSSSSARSRGVTPRNFLERLKLETAAEHALIENATGIMEPGLDLERYRAYLERTFGFYMVVERRLRQLVVWEALNLSATEREKLPLLAEDVVILGNLEPASIRGCTVAPVFASTAEAVGGAYVLEGSTLGGRVISRRVVAALGPDAPRSFLECYGANTGEQWRTFCGALSRFASSREIEDRVITGARETFRAFTRWLER